MDDIDTAYTVTPHKKKKEKPKPKFRQSYATVVVSLAGMAAAIILKSKTPCFEDEDEDECAVPEKEHFYTVMSLVVGAVLGASVTAVVMQKAGRKPALAGVAVPFILSSILQLAATSMAWIYASRFVSGMGVGGVFVSVPSYVAEIADENCRGALGIVQEGMFYTGLQVSENLCKEHEHTLISIAIIVLIIIYSIALIPIPESPYYLQYTSREEDMQRSLKWLKRDLQRMSSHNKEMEMEELDRSHKRKLTYGPSFPKRAIVKAIALSMVLVVCRELTGVADDEFEMEEVFELAEEPVSDNAGELFQSMLVLAVIHRTTQLVDSAGRRLLMILSTFSMGVVLAMRGIFFIFYDEKDENNGDWMWLPYICTIVFMITYYLGQGALSWIIIAELTPYNVKGIIKSIASASRVILYFAVPALYSILHCTAGIYVADLFFSLICIMSALCFVFFLPETKGKTLLEIQEALSQEPILIQNIKKVISIKKEEVC